MVKPGIAGSGGDDLPPLMIATKEITVQFRNLANGYVEDCSAPALWCLLSGLFYFAAKGVWTHFVVAGLLAFFTGGLSWFIYPFFAKGIIKTHYLRRGWVLHSTEPTAADKSVATFFRWLSAAFNIYLYALMAFLIVVILLGILSLLLGYGNATI